MWHQGSDSFEVSLWVVPLNQRFMVGVPYRRGSSRFRNCLSFTVAGARICGAGMVGMLQEGRGNGYDRDVG